VNVTYKIKDAAGLYSTSKVYEPDQEQLERFAEAQIAVMVRELAAEVVADKADREKVRKSMIAWGRDNIVADPDHVRRVLTCGPKLAWRVDGIVYEGEWVAGLGHGAYAFVVDEIEWWKSVSGAMTFGEHRRNPATTERQRIPSRRGSAPR
jgi:hypothetical protein